MSILLCFQLVFNIVHCVHQKLCGAVGAKLMRGRFPLSRYYPVLQPSPGKQHCQTPDSEFSISNPKLRYGNIPIYKKSDSTICATKENFLRNLTLMAGCFRNESEWL